jgi:hypothetical protein
MKKKVYVVDYCKHCKDIENEEQLITANQMEWLLVAAFCRDCTSYQTEVEVSRG